MTTDFDFRTRDPKSGLMAEVKIVRLCRSCPECHSPLTTHYAACSHYDERECKHEWEQRSIAKDWMTYQCKVCLSMNRI